MRSVISALLSRSAPQNAASSRGGPGLNLGYLTGRPNGERLLRTTSEVSTLFAIVEKLSTSVASVKWQLWRKSTTGDDKDRKPVMSHAALDLWQRPNRHYTGRRFREASQQHLELTGEGPWVVVKAGRLPLELWPVRPDRLEPVPDPETFLKNYKYTGGGVPIELPVENVIRQVMPNPLDPYRGLGAVQALLTHLDATKYSAAWNRNFFANSAEPGGVIEVPRELDDVEFDKFRMRWQEQHRGTSNAHRVAILEDGFKWVGNTYTRRDMQFAELDTLGREIIREAFGFPKSMLGSVDDVNRANAEAGELVFGRWLVVPRLDRIKDVLNNELLPMYGEASGSDLEFDYVSPVPKDRAADNEALQAVTAAFSSLIVAGVEPEAAAAQVGIPALPMVSKSGVTPQAAYAAKALVEAGYDSDDVLAALGLPPMRYTPPPAPGAPPDDPPADPPADPSTDPDAPPEDA